MKSHLVKSKASCTGGSPKSVKTLKWLTTAVCLFAFANLAVSVKAQLGPQFSPPALSLQNVTINVPSGNGIGVTASTGGVADLNTVVINAVGTSGGVEIFGDGAKITATNTNITLGNGDFGGSSLGAGMFNSEFHPNPNIIELNGVNITTGSGNKGLYMEDANLNSQIVFNNGTINVGPGAIGVSAEFEGANIQVNNSTVTVGDGGVGLRNFITENFATRIFTNNTIVTVGNNGVGAQFFGGGLLSMKGGSLTVSGSDSFGVLVTAGKPLTEFRTSRATFDGTPVTSGGTGIDVEGSAAEVIFQNGASIVPGNGRLLFIEGTDYGQPDGFQAGTATLTADTNANLTGDITTENDGSNADVVLEHSSVLTGAINENGLAGATGINPTSEISHPIFPGLPPFTVNLDIDSTSTWNMRASSTLNTLTVNPEAHINFADPPAGAFKTLLINNLIGTGGIFRENNDLAAIKGDLIEILTKSEGEHLLTFNNRTAGSDLPVNTALLVVRTPDGGAGFTGQEDGGTFRYFVVHGDGSSVTPVRNDWYLVREDEITPPETTPPPPTNPNPTPAPTPPPTTQPTPPPGPQPTPPEFAPGDDLPLPPEPPPRRLSLADDLTPGANAAIGTFAATMPLFYADMDTLIERLGELRLLAQAPPPAPPTGISKEGGKEIVSTPPPVAPPSGGGVWVRGFGSGSHIDDQVSRSFHQNLGGFQVGADKRLVTRYGDLYLGGFLGYFYAHRDFQNQPFNQDATGTSNAFSVGAYGTLIHPSGFYADLVLKYTQLWNDFDAPNVLSSLGLGPSATANYSIPTFGASLEIGKRWDFGHFFLEPQGQIAGAWAGGADYTVSTGLRVSADSQTSLRGRLGLRAGYHFDWGSRAFEPYAKVSVINEFLGGDRITTNQTAFFPTLSGVGIQAAGGVTARLTDSIYLYGEYDYANSDKIRIPWAVDAGLRWVW